MSIINNNYNNDDCSWIDNIIQEHKKSKLTLLLFLIYRVKRIFFTKKYNDVK